jgi:lactoylglutathione lyase
MKLFSIILPTLVASSSSAFACSGHSQLSERDSPQNNNSSTLFSVGTDPPQPPATLGYMLNHFALVISDVERTVHFYRDVHGLRTVLNYDMPEFTFIYLGYPDGGKNGTGYQTGQEMQNEQKNREGLIEFLHYNVCQSLLLFSIRQSMTV